MRPTCPKFVTFLALLPLGASLIACGGNPPPHVARREIERDLLTLDRALTRYATTKGGFATSIDDLGTAVEEEHRIDPYGRPYMYLPSSQGRHSLVCYGEDGVPGGEGAGADLDLETIRSRRY